VDRTSSGITSVPSSRLGKESGTSRGARLGLRPTLTSSERRWRLTSHASRPSCRRPRANLSASFLRFASCLQLPIADGLSGEFFDLALGLLSRTFDALLIHWSSGRGAGLSNRDARGVGEGVRLQPTPDAISSEY
jgi:hypothetical protein